MKELRPKVSEREVAAMQAFRRRRNRQTETAYVSLSEASNSRNMTITTNTLAAELAKWAVYQSPYSAPDNLGMVVITFVNLYDNSYPSDWEFMKIRKWWSPAELQTAVASVLDQIPEYAAWNVKRNEDGEKIAFFDRYTDRHPDDDFIDLDALVRNMVLAAWKDAVEFSLFNEQFEREHPRDPNDPNRLATGPESVPVNVDAVNEPTSAED